MSDEIRMIPQGGNELPDGWASCQIGEISPVVGGGTPPSKDPSNFSDKNGVPWITPADLSGYKAVFIARGSRNLSQKGFEKSSAKMLPANALLFSSRAPVGYVAIASNPLCTNQGFKSFVLPDGFDPRFGYYYLRHIKPLAEARATGTTFKELSGGAAGKLPFLIAPLPEQKRIADKLDALLGRVDACRARLDRVPALLKRFRQSVLAAAVTGKLTENWREETPITATSEHLIQRIFAERADRYDARCKECLVVGKTPPKRPKNLSRKEITRQGLPEIPETWQWVCWDDITDWITYGFTRPMPHVEKGIPIITAKNVRDGFLDFTEPEQTTKEAFLGLSEKDKPRRNEILITKDGAIRGRAALVQTDEQFCISQSVAVLRFGGLTAHEPFLLRVIQDKFTQNLIEEESSGMAIPHLSITNFGRFPVPLPPLPEQQEIVRRVEALFAFADRIEARLASAQKTVERLTPATLAKAFRGELVPQDPNDEPASALLERLKSAAPEPSSKKQRRSKGAAT